MANVYLGLGTNLGDKTSNLYQAIGWIRKEVGKIVSQSAFCETAPWGFDSENTFLNAALCVKTDLSPLEVLRLTQEIERRMGRKQKSVNGIYTDRTIDIDLLLYDEMILQTPELTLPHPLMTERDFVMRPLTEIAGNVIHPVFRKTLAELWESRKSL